MSCSLLLDPGEDHLPVAQARLGDARDPVHDPDRLDRVVADRRLLGEHHRVGAVVDRVGDVGHLGARRPGGAHHRRQHLGRGDRRLRRAAGSAISRFWAPGTSSIGSSTPRSPRAIMIPLPAASMISSARSAAWGFSIFAISGMSAPRSRSRASTFSRSEGRRTKETASRSIPFSQAKSIQGSSEAPVSGSSWSAPGQVDALVGADRAAGLDLAGDLAALDRERPAGGPGRRRGRRGRPRAPPWRSRPTGR